MMKPGALATSKKTGMKGIILARTEYLDGRIMYILQSLEATMKKVYPDGPLVPIKDEEWLDARDVVAN